MTPEELQSRCDYWLDRFAMGEWRGRCKASVKTPKFIEKLTGMAALAGVCWNATELTAEIYLTRKGLNEACLLHEIFHLLLEGHGSYQGYNETTERTINRLVEGTLKTEIKS